MRDRISPLPQGVGGQSQMRVKLSDGRVFDICTNGQMRWLEEQVRRVILGRAMDKGEDLSEEDLEEKVRQWRENAPYATMEFVRARMNPSEMELWKQNYRFCGVKRSWR